MLRVAHLSDLHLLEDDIVRRKGMRRVKVGYLSFHNPLDPEGRRERAARALQAAADENPDHVVITGDLTEDGAPAQFDVLRQLLDESGLRPEQVTITAGNHDAHGLPWADVLAGPLERWAGHARPGAVVPLGGGARLVHVHTAVVQPFWRSSGTAPDDQLAEVARCAGSGPELVILAQHHPPFRVQNQWIHGLTNVGEVEELLVAHDNLALLYGHMHIERDHEPTPGEGARAFAPCGVVSGDRPVRLYAVEDRRLWPITPAAAAPAARRGSGLPLEGRALRPPTPPRPEARAS